LPLPNQAQGGDYPSHRQPGNPEYPDEESRIFAWSHSSGFLSLVSLVGPAGAMGRYGSVFWRPSVTQSAPALIRRLHRIGLSARAEISILFRLPLKRYDELPKLAAETWVSLKPDVNCDLGHAAVAAGSQKATASIPVASFAASEPDRNCSRRSRFSHGFRPVQLFDVRQRSWDVPEPPRRAATNRGAPSR